MKERQVVKRELNVMESQLKDFKYTMEATVGDLKEKVFNAESRVKEKEIEQNDKDITLGNFKYSNSIVQLKSKV